MNQNELIDLFEEAFSSHCSGSRRTCKCGRVFFNESGGWDWDDGEIEALEKAGATPVDFAISGVIFQGVEYANACDCWHPIAARATAFIVDHDVQIADFLNRRRERIVRRAELVVKVTA